MTDINTGIDRRNAVREVQEALNHLIYLGVTINEAREVVRQHLDRVARLNDPEEN